MPRIFRRNQLKTFPRPVQFFFSLCLGFTLLFLGSAKEAPTHASHGIVVADMDLSVKSGDDFFRYADGGWLKRVEIPPDRSSVSVFSMLLDVANRRTADLIEEAAKSTAPPGSGPRKIADLYKSYMDEAALKPKVSRRSSLSSTKLPPSTISADWRAFWGKVSGLMLIR